jgi:hypothetical protein
MVVHQRPTVSGDGASLCLKNRASGMGTNYQGCIHFRPGMCTFKEIQSVTFEFDVNERSPCGYKIADTRYRSNVGQRFEVRPEDIAESFSKLSDENIKTLREALQQLKE